MARRPRAAPRSRFETTLSSVYESDDVNKKPPVKLSVIDIRRYPTTVLFSKVLGHILDTVFAYDIFVTDGVFKTKAVLWPDINHLVESHYLTERSEITVTDYFVRWNEGSTNELLPFFVIKSLTVDAPSHTLTPDRIQTLKFIQVDKLEKLYADSPDEHNDERAKRLRGLEEDLREVPLIGGRGTYIHVWADDVPLGQKWTPKNWSVDLATVEEALGPNEMLFTVERLASDFAANHYKAKKYRPLLPVLIGRIIRKAVCLKSHLTNFAKPNEDVLKRWYFTFTLTIADSSGAVDVVFWDRLCPTMFTSVHVGDVLLVRNFRVQGSFKVQADGSDIQSDTSDKSNKIIELNVNPAPESRNRMRVLSGQVMQTDAIKALPPVGFKLFSAAQLMGLADDAIADFLGLVLFVSDASRVKTESGGFFLQKFLRVQDVHDNKKEVTIRIHTNSRIDLFDSVAVGDAVLVTNLKLKSITPNARTRDIQLHATRMTEIFMNDDLLPFEDEESIYLATLIAQREALSVAPLAKMDDGLNCFRLLYRQCYKLSIFREVFGQETVTLISDIPSVCSDLTYLEERNLYIQGRVLEITVGKKLIQNGSLWTGVDQDLEAPIAASKRTIYYVLIQDINKQNKIKLALPAFPVLSQGEERIEEGYKKSLVAASRMNQLLRFFPNLIPATQKKPTEKAVLKDLTAALQRLSSPVVFGVSLYRAEHNDVECVITNVFL